MVWIYHLCWITLTASANAHAPVAKVSFGDLAGSALQAADEYVGIPYAKNPTGELRFMPPEDWSAPYDDGGRDVRSWGARCMQAPVDNAKIPYDENCLFLNIWSPRVSQESPLPIMFFIHGGAFLFGAGDMFNGTELALATGCVVVTTNYRLGAFGFLQLGVASAAANAGMLDQQSALRWIKREAKAFRGDGDNILIFGQSAGGISVGVHLIISSSNGLFQRALCESGPATVVGKDFAHKTGDHLAGLLNCGDLKSRLACLQEKSATNLLNASTTMLMPLPGQSALDVPWSFQISIDDVIIHADPIELMLAGKLNPIAGVIVGFTHDEAFSGCCDDPTTGHRMAVNLTYFQIAVAKALNFQGRKGKPGDVEKLLTQYVPKDSPKDLGQALGNLYGDLSFICKSRAMLRALAQSGIPVHKYVFNHRAEFDPAPKSWRVYHTSELPFVFGTGESGSLEILPSMTAKERMLSATIRDLWSSFAKGGTSTKSGQEWPTYNATLDNHLLLDTVFPRLPEGHGFHNDYCNTWDEIWRAQEDMLLV